VRERETEKWKERGGEGEKRKWCARAEKGGGRGGESEGGKDLRMMMLET